MFEGLRQPDRLAPQKSDRDRTLQVFHALIEEAEHPMGYDQRIAAWCRATAGELLRDGGLGTIMQDIFAFRRVTNSHFPPIYAMRLAQRAAQKQILEDIKQKKHITLETYREQGQKEEFWSQSFYGEIFDPHEFDVDMSFRNNDANVPNRGKAFDLATRFFAERLGDSPTVVDVGAAKNLVLKKWKGKDQFPYSSTKVVRPKYERYVGEEYIELEDESDKINHLLGLKPLLSSGLGIDIYPIHHDDEEMNCWVLSCSFYPSELINYPERVKEFEALSSTRIPGISYAEKNNIDVRDAESLSQMDRYLHGQTVDMFIFSNVLYEMSPDDIAQTFANLRPYCHDRSLFVINEFARANPKAPNGLEFIHQNKWIIPYNFRTIVIDPLKPEVAPYELFMWRTARCDELWLSKPAKQALNEIEV